MLSALLPTLQKVLDSFTSDFDEVSTKKQLEYMFIHCELY